MAKDYYEKQLLVNMLKDQSKLPYVFENIELKYITPKSIQYYIFYSMAMLWKNKRTLNKITIDVNCTTRPGIDDDDWLQYLDHISDNSPNISIEECVEFLVEEFIREELKRKTSNLHKLSQSNPIDYPYLISAAEDVINTVNLSDKLNSEPPTGIFSEDDCLEFSDPFLIERFTIYKKNLTFIAGAAKNMKSSLACFMEKDLLTTGTKILHFPVDSNYKEVIANLISMETRINRQLIMEHSNKNPKLTPEEYEIVTQKHDIIRKSYIETGQLIIDDKSNSLPEINLKIRTVQPDLVIIDLVNSIVLPGVEKGDTTEAFETPIILNRLKQLSKQMDCAVLGLVWLNTTRRRPVITDLYGSKASEKWASKVWLVYYAYVYEMIPTFKDIFEIIDGVSRFGENKIYPSKCEPMYCNFGYSDHDPAVRQAYQNLTKLPPHMVWRSPGGKP